MAEQQLTATGGAGQQTTTQSPQAVPAAGSLGGPTATNIQSGSASSLQGGTQLNNTSLSSGIKLNAPVSAKTGTTATASLPLKPHHHLNPALLSVPVLLIVLSGVMIWFTRAAAKNTTNY